MFRGSLADTAVEVPRGYRQSERAVVVAGYAAPASSAERKGCVAAGRAPVVGGPVVVGVAAGRASVPGSTVDV